jgi:D-serine deaminase-like pyridoxal phosphate-dependent protein
MGADWFKLNDPSKINTPALLVFPDRIAENLARMIAIAGSTTRLRTHVKTHKTPEIIQLQVDKGITKFKCSTISEAEMIAMSGGKDVLLAYQLVGPNIQRFLKLQAQYPEVKFSTLLDNQQSLKELSKQSSTAYLTTNVYVDINNGMDRTGISNPELTIELIAAIIAAPSLHFEGIHVYDGHIHDAELNDRIKHCEDDFSQVDQLLDQLKESNIEVPNIIAGGTPTFPIHAKHPERELSPGTPILWDYGYRSSFVDLDYEYAAVIATRVISNPQPHVYCLDLGYKAIASEMPHPRFHFFNLDDYEVLNHSEEHLVLKLPTSIELNIGDVLYGSPRHICPSVALYDHMYIVKYHTVIDKWKVLARDREITF